MLKSGINFKIFFVLLAYIALSKNALYAQLTPLPLDSAEDENSKVCIVPDSVQNSGSQSVFIPSPSITYSPETSLSLGFFAMYYFKLGRKGGCTHPSNIQFLAAYTLNRQFWAEPIWEVFLHDDNYVMKGRFLYQQFPELFYGIGNNTLPGGELYSHQLVRLITNVQKRIYDRFFIGPQYHLQYMFNIEAEPGGKLENLSPPNRIEGATGGLASGAGAIAVWDSRDLILFPTQGVYAELGGTHFTPYLGSKFSFNQFTADLRKYFSFGRRKVLAMQLFAQHNTGQPPFRMLALMGNNQLMRGYYMGRYRDRNYLAGQMEYRFPVYKRFGMAVFGGAGQVAAAFNHMHPRRLHPNYGFGLRYLYNKKENINIRLDFGFGPGTSGQYVTIGEAF